MTLEDVIPVWLWNALKRIYKTDELTLSVDGRTIRPLKMRRYAIAIGGVCASCNNGWMHDLESAFRAIAIPAITGEAIKPGAELRLDRGAQTVFATWALKTWLLLSRANHYATHNSVRSPEALRYLYDHGEPPEGPVIYVGTVNLPNRHPIQVQTSRLSHEGTDHHGTMSLMNFRPLAFCIAMAEEGGIVTAPNAQLAPALSQIWPYQSAEVRWPTEGILTQAWIEFLFPPGIVFPA